MEAMRNVLLAVGCAVLTVAMVAPVSAALATTYTYPGEAPQPCYFGTDATFVGGVYGSGYLNNGVFGNQAFLDSTPRPRNAYTSDAVSYQLEGDAAWNDYVGGFYYSKTGGITSGTSGTFAIKFDLGATYSLSTMILGTSEMQTYGVGIPGAVTISDAVHANVVDTTYHGLTASDGPAGRGLYRQLTIDVSSLSGRYITVTLSDNSWGTGGQFGLNEIQFNGTPIPEPAAVALLAAGLLACGWRKRK